VGVCVCVGMCVCVCGWVLVIYALVFRVFCTVCTVFFVVPFMYIYCYLFSLYLCKDYCHPVTTPFQ